MARRVTTFDIAREAGVSRTTVSHVLNNQPGVHLSPKTRARVLTTARKLGYVPNSAAQMLVTGRSRAIGLVLSRADLLAIDGFIPIMIYGMNEVCRTRGYRLLIETMNQTPGENAYLDLAKSKRVDSLIVVDPRRDDLTLKKVIRSKFPVLLAGTLGQHGENALATQEGQASCQITRHLLSLGHRRVAHIGHASLNYLSVYRRFHGYRIALETAGVSFDQYLVAEGDFSFESGYRAMKQILASHAHPTALFAGNDTIAIGAMLALREAGLSIPRDFAVGGYDDLPIAAYASPPLTTVRTHAFEQGKLLAEAAIGLMDDAKIGSQQDVVQLELIIRESCGATTATNKSQHPGSPPPHPARVRPAPAKKSPKFERTHRPAPQPAKKIS
jgi:DNA-binding LacI/PurR family transcriptional regulator